MARTRMLSADFFRDEELCELPFEARILFAGLWGIADREGRSEYRVKRIAADIFPFDQVDVEKMLSLLSPKFITIYEVESRKYLQINNFSKYQKPHKKEAASHFPAPPRLSPEITGPSPEITRPCPAVTGNRYTVTGNSNRGGEGEIFPPASPEFSPMDVKNILAKYPLQSGVKGAEYAVGQSLSLLLARGEGNPVAFLTRAVEVYARSDVVKKGRAWAPRRFFEEGHYDDDPATWEDRKKPDGEGEPSNNGYHVLYNPPQPSHEVIMQIEEAAAKMETLADIKKRLGKK